MLAWLVVPVLLGVSRAGAEITDEALIFSAATVQKANALVEEIRASTTPPKEIIVRTIPRLSSNDADPKALAERLYRQHKMNGVLLLVVVLIAAGYSHAEVSELAGLSTDQVRAQRAEAQSIETGLSYLRRVVQGRLDIVDAELARRRAGGEPGDTSSLIERLPEILGDHLRAPGNGRLTSQLEPGAVDAELQERLDAIVAGTDLDAIGTVDDERLAGARDDHAAPEGEISTRRRSMFDRIDALQAELTRRYKTGEATVESLLR